MSLEIERRFLMPEVPAGWLDAAEGKPIRQGYLIVDEKRVLRIRQKGAKYVMTVKSGAGLTRHEEEQAIDQALFDLLWPLTEGRRNIKTRHTREIDGLVYELDVFEADLAPLIMLEVEFDNEASAHGFQPPGYVGREVTEDERYNNASLAVHGLPEDFSA